MFNNQDVICLGLRHVFFPPLVQILFLDIFLHQPAKNLETLDK